MKVYALLATLALLALSACNRGGSVRVPNSHRKQPAYVEYRVLHAGPMTRKLGVLPEPEPAGFEPSTEPYDQRHTHQTARHEPSSSGVVTLVMLDAHENEQFRVTGVDDTAPVYAVGHNIYLFPTVGAGGERLTKVIYQPLGDEVHVRGELPRLKRFLWVQDNFVYGIPLEGEPGLFQPVAISTEGALPVASGAAGARVLPASLSEQDLGTWRAWLVRPDGETKDRWQLSLDPVLTNLETLPTHYRDVRIADAPGATLFLGTLDDGRCQVVPYRFDPGIAWADTPTAATCDEALQGAHASLTRIVAEKKAHDLEENVAARARYAAAQAQRKLDEEKAAKERRENHAKYAQALADYRRYADLRMHFDACRAASILPVDEHVLWLSVRIAGSRDGVASEEIACARKREHTAESSAALSAAISRGYVPPDQGAAPLPRFSGQGPALPSLPTQSHEQWMKRANDYTHGSGKASSCPYSASSGLCR